MKRLGILLLVLFSPLLLAAQERLDMQADFTASCGSVKPLHGVCNSPRTYGDSIPSFIQAGIPFSRLHDTGGAFGGSRFVDVPNIFPDFDADVNDPESYDFAFTDAYLKGLTSSGCQIIYRLGVTIENQHYIKAYRIFPPKDYHKWAEICEHIIRHYNEGWDNGFHYGIKYWEIWNEPDGDEPSTGKNAMWKGNAEQYYELYRVASTYLKEKHPDIKVGGYASCGFYALGNPNSSPRGRYFINFFTGFLNYLKNQPKRLPLDFFSWHYYCRDAEKIKEYSDYVRKQLDDSGYKDAEIILDEWNCIPEKKVYEHWAIDTKNEPGASGTAAAFAQMQYGKVDIATYYDSQPSATYCGLYWFPTQKVTKNYYAFYAFNQLYRLGTACKVKFAKDNVTLIAAKSRVGNSAAILAANFDSEARNVVLNIKGKDFENAKCMVIDKDHYYERDDSVFDGKILKMKPYSTILITTSDMNPEAPKDQDR